MAGLINRRMREQIYPTKEFFDPELKLAPDYHLWLQLLIRGAYAYYIPEPLAYYRKHEEAMTMPTNLNITSDRLSHALIMNFFPAPCTRDNATAKMIEKNTI